MKRLLLFTMMCLLGVFTLNAQTREAYDPVKWINATENETSVNVSWSMDYLTTATEDFETGSFATRDWKNDGEYPWVITENAYQGKFAMKSSCEKVDRASSAIELTVEVPFDGFMSFNHKVSSEDNADYGNFYIDDVLYGTISGNREWRYAEFFVTEGTHTYKWEYVKDGSRHTYGDTYIVDNVVLYKEAEVKAGWIGYDDGKWATSIGTGSVSPMYWGVSFPTTLQYAGLTMTKLAVYDAEKGGSAQYTANIYLGGVDAPETLVSTQSFTLQGKGELLEIDLATPVAIDGTQPLWITLYCEQSVYPAAASLRSEYSTADWLSLDGKVWEHAYIYDLNVSWMMRGLLEDAAGNVRVLSSRSAAPTFEGKVATGTFVATQATESVNVGPAMSNERGFISEYNLYRKDLYNNTTELLAGNTTATSYTDEAWASMGTGAYKWGVASLYEGATQSVVYSESFENGSLPQGWTVYNENLVTPNDKPNDSQNWKVVSSHSSLAPKDGQGFAAGISKWYYDDARFYLVSPQIKVQDGAAMSFSYVNTGRLDDIEGEWWYSQLCLYVSDSPTGPWTEVWSSEESVNNVWTLAEVDIAAYAGQDVYFAFCNQYNGYGAWTAVDDIKIFGSISESEIVWSNTLSKDMSTKVIVAVETDSGDPVAGTLVNLVNTVESEYVYSVVLGKDDTYTFENFRKGVYEVSITKDGFVSDYDGKVVKIWDETEIECYLAEDLKPIENLYVSPTGWVMWDGTNIGVGDEFSFDFDDGTLNGWVTIDADNDNYTWQNSFEIMAPGSGHNYSIACVTSMSWIYGVVLTPDNYLITDKKYLIDETSKLRFYVCAQDASAPNDHYGVAVSLGGNTDTKDFVTIWEETLTAKSGSVRSTRGTRDQGAWYEKVVDLSDYAGQEIYIALRHFNCTDQFYINVDDISLESTARNNRALETYQVYLNGELVAENLTRPYYQHENLVDGQQYTTTVVPVYSMGEGQETSYTWKKVACDKFDGVTDLTAEYFEGKTTVTWTMPETETGKKSKSRGENWLKYDNGIYDERIGLTYDGVNFEQFKWGVMFPASDVAKYAGQYLTKVSMYDCEEYEGELFIYEGGSQAPVTLLHSQTFTMTGSNDFQEVALTSVVELSGNQNVWVVLSSGNGKQPAASCVDQGDANSRWIYYEGYGWLDNAYVSMPSFTWMIRACVSDEKPAGYEADAIGVMMYRNGKLISQLVEGETFVDEEAMAGDEYTVRVVYGGEKDFTYYAMSCPQTVVADLACTAPKNFHAYSTVEDGKSGAKLLYPYIAPTSEWLQYDDGNMQESLGSESLSTFYWGVMFPAEKLADYAGTSLTKVLLYDYVYEEFYDGVNNLSVEIYYGGSIAPELLIHAEQYAGTGAGEFAEVELSYPLPVSGEENIWVVLKSNEAGKFPAAIANDCGDKNGRWASIDGEVWEDIAGLGINGTFMIRAFVTNERGVSKSIDPSTRDLTLKYYNIYRGTTLDNIEYVASTTDKTYFDEIEKGSYYYQVTAVYEENGEECESAPARAYYDYSQNYVLVEVTSVEENDINGLMIYPNPTNGNLNINVEAMRRVTIANALGQVVYDQEVDGDNTIINMAQYQTGVYMVRITTDNGVAVKRVSKL